MTGFISILYLNSFGSGYYIGDNIVMTAGHVVYKASGPAQGLRSVEQEDSGEIVFDIFQRNYTSRWQAALDTIYSAFQINMHDPKYWNKNSDDDCSEKPANPRLQISDGSSSNSVRQADTVFLQRNGNVESGDVYSPQALLAPRFTNSATGRVPGTVH